MLRTHTPDETGFIERDGSRRRSVYTVEEGIILDPLSGIETGHRELLDRIDSWLERGTQ